MKNRFTIFVLFISLFCLYGRAFAQSAGINFMMGFPQADFQKSINRTGFGIGGEVNFWSVSPSMPFTLGLDASYLNYGSEDRNEPFSYEVPDVTVNVNRTNNIVNFHLLFKIMPPEGNLRPYIEGLLGGSYLYTETKVGNTGNYDEEVASTTNFDDWAWSYGGGGGLMFKVFDFNSSEAEDENFLSRWKNFSLWIDLKARYMLGSQAEYLKEGSMRIDRGRVYITPSKSDTDLITAHFGVIVQF
ncbi:MAG: PorT family protein [Ignavibacteria bacterium]|jgi:hypothetical protein|nr:PorT family protein [Ignavibacteria bacterium]MCU7504451.1 PorT family protein [Ignavibacteria bacterium]MCU7517458.1 PorT family protein [Ignavibacteria bacterium]